MKDTDTQMLEEAYDKINEGPSIEDKWPITGNQWDEYVEGNPEVVRQLVKFKNTGRIKVERSAHGPHFVVSFKPGDFEVIDVLDSVTRDGVDNSILGGGNPREDFNRKHQQLLQAYDWDYEENEGGDIRFDWDNSSRSVWLRSDGYVEGELPPGVKV